MHIVRSFLILLLVVSCSGGGSGSSPMLMTENATPPVPPPEPSISFDEAKAQYEANSEYQGQWGLDAINASSAYARGATGAGIIIGITDSGLDSTHAEINSTRIDPRSRQSYQNYQPNTRQMRHGTYVTSIAAGELSENTDTPMHGVAFDSTVFFIAIELAEPDENYDPVDLGDSSGNNSPDFSGIDSFFSQLFSIHNNNDVDIVNNSYGYSGNIIDYTEAQIRSAFPRTIREMAQQDVPDYQKTIYVWSAGNAGGYADQGVDFSSPEIFPGLTAYIDELQSHSIAVVSIDEEGQISEFSNRCGIVASFCVAAPGGDITLAYPVSFDDQGIFENVERDCKFDNSCFAVGGGTSFAAPFVSGALAVMADYFEGQLGNTELVERLFSTANKTGIYADTFTYGQGLIDLDAATRPVGQLSAVSLSANQLSPWHQNFLSISNNAIGDAIFNGFANMSLILFDELGAPFRMPMLNLVNQNNFNYNLVEMQHHMRKKEHFYNSSAENFAEYLHYEKNNFSTEKMIGYRDTFLEKISGFSMRNNNIYINYGFSFDRNIGLTKYRQIFNSESIIKDFVNPWSNFTKDGITLGRFFSYPSAELLVSISYGKEGINRKIFQERNSNLITAFNLNLPKMGVSLQTGLISEKNGNHGIAFGGEFSDGIVSNTRFFGLNLLKEMKYASIFASSYVGYSDNEYSKSSYITSISDVKSNSYGIGISSKILNDLHKITFYHNQPLVINSGNLNLKLPTYRFPNGNVLFSNNTISLKSSALETNTKVMIESKYEKLNIAYNLEYKNNPYHSLKYNNYWYFSVNLNVKF